MDLPSDDDLRKLTPAASVAYAARGAMRVRPLYRLRDDSLQALVHRDAIDRASDVAVRRGRTPLIHETKDNNAYHDAVAGADDDGDSIPLLPFRCPFVAFLVASLWRPCGVFPREISAVTRPPARCVFVAFS